MFKKNSAHEQETFFNDLDSLSSTAKKMLDSSWAHSFYEDYFCKIDESAFRSIYSSKKSRPNIPVNILLGLETIKSGFGWSDEVLYENFLFNIQVRYALGLTNLKDGYFNLRTLYNFRSTLHKYNIENKINLVEKAFETVTDKQISKFKIKTGIQRMDSTLVQSNIQNMGRLQLIVEFIGRTYRVLTLKDQKKYKKIFSQYTKENSLHYCYRVKSEEAATRLEQIGVDINKMLELLKKNYNNVKEFQKLKQVFSEHYHIKKNKIEVKKNQELKGSNIQSPDDDDATYKKKGKDKAKGCVSNISETCDKKNDIQLITKVSTESNTTDDQKLYTKDVKNINNRMDLDTMVTDAGYIGELADEASSENDIEHKVTSVKGKKLSNEKISIDDFEIKENKKTKVTEITCPTKQTVQLKPGRKANRMTALFSTSSCENCTLQNECPTKVSKKKPARIFRVSKREIKVSRLRKDVKNMGAKRNIRASVESTIRSVIHPFGGHLCKMPVRGKFRISYMIILSAAMVNVRRVHRHYVKSLHATINYLINFISELIIQNSQMHISQYTLFS